MKIRLLRKRMGKTQRDGNYRQVEYSTHFLTDWVEINNVGVLRKIEDAIDDINKRRVRNSQLDDYFTLEVDAAGGIDTLEELKDYLRDLDKNQRGYRPIKL